MANNVQDKVVFDPMEWEYKKEEFLDTVIEHEGGYVDNPLDPGGETKYGISKKQYPKVDIKNLDEQAAKEIYKKDFLPSAEVNYGKNEFAFKMADIGINAGPRMATEIMQRSLNTIARWYSIESIDLDEDGLMGSGTRKAYNKIISNPDNRKDLMALIVANQNRYYAGEEFNTKTISKEQVAEFGKGWKGRASYRGEG
jgi:lysozyme family protein